MKEQDYSATITVTATPSEAFEKIARIDGWWKASFVGNAAKLNDAFTVSFGEPSFVNFTVTEAVPERRLVWSVSDCFLHWFQNKKEWNGTKVVWEILSSKDATQIKMTHVGLVPGVECYEICETGWNGHVRGSLAKFINDGIGTPQ